MRNGTLHSVSPGILSFPGSFPGLQQRSWFEGPVRGTNAPDGISWKQIGDVGQIVPRLPLTMCDTIPIACWTTLHRLRRVPWRSAPRSGCSRCDVPDVIVSLEDGEPYKDSHQLSKLGPEVYCRNWGLPSKYPMTKPNERRRLVRDCCGHSPCCR
jgi:hypothetical protein